MLVRFFLSPTVSSPLFVCSTFNENLVMAACDTDWPWPLREQHWPRKTGQQLLLAKTATILTNSLFKIHGRIELNTIIYPTYRMWLRLKPDCLSSDCLYMQPNKKAMYNAKNKKKKIDRLAPQSVLQHVLANRSFSYLQYLKVSWINLAIVQLIKIDHLYSISLPSFHEMPICILDL